MEYLQPLRDRKLAHRRRARLLAAALLLTMVLLLLAAFTTHYLAAVLMLVFGLALAIARPWIVGDLEAVELTDQVRRACWPERTFVRLRDGVTHYELAGPDDGPKVVLVTGLASPFFIWDHQFQLLADAGYRVLRYDNFGRGLSDRPNLPYDDKTFDAQLLGLLDALGWTEAVDLIGLSMGGSTVIRFADRHPGRVARMVLIAPAALPSPPTPKGRLLGWRGVGEWLMKAFGDESIISALPKEIGDDPDKNRRAVEAYLEQMQYRGYKRALLQTIRNNPMNNLLPALERLGAQALPALLIWGDRDTVVPFAHHEQIQQAMPGLRFHPIAGGTHPVCFHKPEEVNPLLLDFLATTGRATKG